MTARSEFASLSDPRIRSRRTRGDKSVRRAYSGRDNNDRPSLGGSRDPAPVDRFRVYDDGPRYMRVITPFNGAIIRLIILVSSSDRR